jgi:large subunit ribosomal protein L24
MNKVEKNHVKKGDNVKVISGEQKGFIGRIQSILKKKSSVILDGIVPRVKYIKSSTPNQASEKKELPILIHSSNVMLWDKELNKGSRIGYKEITINSMNNDSSISTEKKRYFKKSGNFVPE